MSRIMKLTLVTLVLINFTWAKPNLPLIKVRQVRSLDEIPSIDITFPNGQKDDTRLNYKLDFYDELLPVVNEQIENGNNVIITGDWNTAHHPIDLARPKENEKTSGFMPIERERIDTYVSNGWVDTFRHFHSDANRYSWWTYRFGARERNVGWRIDYFFVNETFVEQLDDAEIHPDIMGSDHCPVSLTLKRDSL